MGCSSSSDNGASNNPSGQGGGFGFGGNMGGGGFGAFSFGGNNNPPPATCNNGQVDPGEDCDGNVGTATCQSVTLGAQPNGTLSCTSCRFNTSGCSSNNPGGGATGAGGTGTGGGIGSGGGGGLNMGGANNGSGGLTNTGGPNPTALPTAKGACPQTANLNGTEIQFNGNAVKVWSGAASGGGPLLIYWYATGSNDGEPSLWMSPAVTKFVQLGGMVAAPAKTTSTGSNTGDNVWYTGDVDQIADDIVACAIQNQKIDPRRIHVGGYSAGGLQTTYHWFARSGYVASVMTYSGGDTIINKTTMQDPSHVPPALVTHGGAGQDTFIIDFAQTSATWETDIKGMGGFAIDCDDGGAHTAIATRAQIAPQATQFFLDHPYGVKPEPYTAIPAGWPSYCKIVSP